jgi:hypothetical protein
MAHWPKTFRGNLYAIPLAIAALVGLAQLAVALSGPVIWILTAAVFGSSALLYFWTRRVQGVRDLDVANAPSFADVLEGIHARERLALPA